MAGKSSAYTFKDVVVTLNGLRVVGGWDGDDAIVVTPLADVGQMMVGADGSSIFSQSANDGATIQLRLQHTSPTHRQLMQSWAMQRAGRLDGFPLDIKELRSGNGGTTDQAFISAAPEQSLGVNATVRLWTLVTGSWEPAVPNP